MNMSPGPQCCIVNTVAQAYVPRTVVHAYVPRTAAQDRTCTVCPVLMHDVLDHVSSCLCSLAWFSEQEGSKQSSFKISCVLPDIS